MKETEKQFNFPADIERMPTLPERYIENELINDFTALEHTF